jgi:hypothetical protein
MKLQLQLFESLMEWFLTKQQQQQRAGNQKHEIIVKKSIFICTFNCEQV